MVARVPVLVVEDDADVREVLVDLLGLAGYAVEGVESAEAGLASLARRHFAVVVTDYNLPGLTGGELLEVAQRSGLLAGAGAVMVTAHPNPLRPAGVPVLRKPLDVDVLLSAVEAQAGADLAPAAA